MSQSVSPNLTEGPVGRHLIRLSVPMSWGILAMISFQLVNIFYISRLGTDTLAAITFTFPVTFVIFSLTLGMGIATSSVISRMIGSRKQARARRLATHAMILALLCGIVFSLLGLAVQEPVFRMMGATPSMMPTIQAYMTVWFAGSVFINTPVVGNAVLRASGDTKTPALVMTGCALANAVIDPFLIFGWGVFPKLGVQGAAISTVFVNIVAMGIGFYIMKYKKRVFVRSAHHIKLLGDSAKRLAVIAIPAGIANIIQPVANGVLIALLSAHGTAAVAGFGIVTRVEAMALVPIMSLAVGMAPILGQNWGARNMARVSETLHKAFLFAIAWSAAVAIALFLFRHGIAEVFSKEETVANVAALYFSFVPSALILGNLVHGWASGFNALGMPKRSFVMIMTKSVLVALPLAALGSALWGVKGIFGAIAAANLGCGLLFHYTGWRYLADNILENETVRHGE